MGKREISISYLIANSSFETFRVNILNSRKSMEKVIIRQISPELDPILYSQVNDLRNQLLRLPIGLDLFQEDLSQEVNLVILAATTTSIVAKSNDNNSSNNPEEIDTDKNEAEKTIPTEQGEQELQLQGKVVGCLMLEPLEGDEKTLKLRQMAVLPVCQGQGLGRKLLQSAEEYAKQDGKTRLYLHARTHAVGFYLKAGFLKITETEFLEVGIPHHAMEKLLL